MGTGNFFGLIPDSMSRSRLYGVELDPITGNIAKLLYPNAAIQIKGYQDTNYPDNFFDLAIGNVPFANVSVRDPSIKDSKLRNKLHDFFFVKTLDKVKPGGLIMFISSTGTMDAQNGKHTRNYLAQRANLVAAIRLPNTAFKKNAGTSVTTDIIILQKLATGQVSNNTSWVETSDYEIDGRDLDLNQYFIDNPNMMLGTPVISTMYGSNSALGLDPSSEDLVSDIVDVMDTLPEKIFSTVGAPKPTHAEPIINDDDSMRSGTVLLEGGVVMRKTQKGTLTPIPKGLQAQAKLLLKLKDFVRSVITKQTDSSANEKELTDRKITAYTAYVKKVW